MNDRRSRSARGAPSSSNVAGGSGLSLSYGGDLSPAPVYGGGGTRKKASRGSAGAKKKRGGGSSGMSFGMRRTLVIGSALILVGVLGGCGYMLMNYDISIYNRMPKPQAPKSKPRPKDHPDPHHLHQTEREMRTRIERERRERGDREHRQPPKHHVQQHDDHDDDYTDDKDPHEIKRHRDLENNEMKLMLARRHAERDQERLERHKTAREGLLEEAYKDVPDDARRAMIEARRRRAKEMMEAEEELGMIEKVRMDRNKRLDKVHEGRMAGMAEMGDHASLVAAKTKEEEARKLAEHEQRIKATQLIEDVLVMVRANKVVIFSKTTCSHSTAAKTLLDATLPEDKKAKVVELDQIENGDLWQVALKILTGRPTVPNIFVDGNSVGGNDEIQAISKGGTLLTLLGLEINSAEIKGDVAA
mmetsp:Transcript_45614/g.89117  ORF Transcript_45614/g.89117 Transcript_45614/m.89117 type:complete len:417 (-) Transcript_45614:79-1329(-)|eukprot:CAMPEP_0194323638 /NCGR_PEP_ID=MMETSP0171-20130528/25871_1 /TAXON_ID=218684 /ORGANISM="Corethron pennatum, Strain L29A3" /LENGTH=416 /DNA_ID=CAMNT_0039082339 /DNA_START=50 /DNA_END=1300 /DNA_ORIENTATION=+